MHQLNWLPARDAAGLASDFETLMAIPKHLKRSGAKTLRRFAAFDDFYCTRIPIDPHVIA